MKRETELWPIVTRWGTFLDAGFYHIDNFDKVSNFILNLQANTEKIQSKNIAQ